MKLIHMSDIHGDFKTFDRALEIVKKSDADVLAITGDLAGKYLPNPKNEIIKIVSNQYKKFKKRFNDLDQKVLLVPGNWDCNFIEDYLSEENIHKKGIKKIGKFGFAGYGGVNLFSIGMTNDMKISFKHDEVCSYLSKYRDASVVLTHVYSPDFNNWGRSLILSGHTHNQDVYEDKEQANLISIANNLANYDSRSGTFLEFEIGEDFIANLLNVYDLQKV